MTEDARDLAHDLVRQHKRAKEERERNAKSNGKARRQRHVANMLALVTFLDNHPAWRGAVRFNELTANIELCDPWPPRDTPERVMRPLREPGDLLEAVIWLQGNGYPGAGKNLTWDALCCIAARNSFHPVRDYLNGLQWDGTVRLHNLFAAYFNADLPETEDRTPEGELSARDRVVAYLEHISTGFMVAAVARVMRPGCKVDNVPVAVSDEGFNKSQGFAALCADPAWFSDDLSPDLVQRDTKESLSGKWIIELSEMPHVRKEVERVKAFFSRQTDRYRRAYDRTTQDHPRQQVFVGTSNDLELVSVTGNRRFWPFEVAGPIELERIRSDRDQLWAEALHLYRQGAQWWLKPTIEAIATEQQQAFGEHDIWQDKIGAWLDTRTVNKGHQDEYTRPFTLDELFAGCLNYSDTSLVPKPDQNRAAACLKRLGFRRKRKSINRMRAYWWENQKHSRILKKLRQAGQVGQEEASFYEAV